VTQLFENIAQSFVSTVIFWQILTKATYF